MRRGFTLVEILVVVFILAILTAVGLSALSAYGERRALESSAQQIETTLALAQSQTLASSGRTQYGVHFAVGSSTITLFPGAAYTEGATNNIVRPLDTRVKIADLGGPTTEDLVFARLTGELAASGTITLVHIHDTNATTTITYHVSGLTEHTSH